MGLIMLENTKDDIHKAYENKSLPKIGKETLYVFDRVVHFMLSTFKDRLKGITFESNEIDFDESFLLSQKNKDHMLKKLTFTQKDSFSLSDVDFGKIKVDLERWYYHMGGKGMYFEYKEEYLITPKDASDILRVSTVTLNKYMKQGLETINTTSHNKIPKHAVELWKDPVYAIRMHMLMQEKKLRNQSLEDQLKEVRDEILELQKQYKTKTVKQAMNNCSIDDIDAMDDPADFRHWEDLEIEEKNILEKLTGGTGFV